MDTDGGRISLYIYIGILLITTILHILFSSSASALEEIRPKLKNLSEKNHDYDILLKQEQHPRRLERTILTERVFYSILQTILLSQIIFSPMKNLLSSAGSILAYIISLVIVILISLIYITSIGHYLPDKIGTKNPEKYALKNAKLLSFYIYLLLPLQGVTSVIGCLLTGTAITAPKDTVTEEDILLMVDAGNENGLIEEQQKEMINNIFEFDDAVVSDVMTHRTEIIGVSLDMKIMDVVYLAVNEGYSRFPVYHENMDNIIGVLIVKDLLGLIGSEEISGFSIKHFMRKIIFVPETAKCKNVLAEMSHKKVQMAVAVDEYGGTAGIVTMEDILEEIVGNIQDEYDDEEIEIREVTTGVYTIDGKADPEEVAETLGIELPEEQEFDTMSAFIVELLGHIPDEEEAPSVDYQGIRFTVLLIKDNWISKIKAVKITDK
ncbi:MAG: HlyC/CorC family transporter [Ruminococcus sp.]|nr:HlyC/CorC family transporter [Ruminococcus sp.]